MKLLFIDIETSPNVADVWGLFQQNISLNQLHESSRMICFAAKWYGEDKVRFHSDFLNNTVGMVYSAHKLLDDADVVCHYNGARFDVPHLNREFLLAGLDPPAPFQQIDLLETAKRKFKFPSNKLDYVTQAVGLQGKVKHAGHSLWTQCLSGDKKAWKEMEKYNKQDVVLLEQLYEKLLPWISGHPNVQLYSDNPEDILICPNCGSGNVQRRGFAYTSVSRFQRFSCSNCGSWSRVGKRDAGTELRPVK